MNKKELLNEFELEFEKLKQQLNLNSTLKELDDIFFFKDFVLSSGFISPRLDRMLCARIRDTFNNWMGQFHSWILPNTSSIINMTEHQVFSDEEKIEITKLMNIFMAFVYRNILLGLEKNFSAQKEFIDDSVTIWNQNLPSIIKYCNKVNLAWQEHAKN